MLKYSDDGSNRCFIPSYSNTVSSCSPRKAPPPPNTQLAVSESLCSAHKIHSSQLNTPKTSTMKLSLFLFLQTFIAIKAQYDDRTFYWYGDDATEYGDDPFEDAISACGDHAAAVASCYGDDEDALMNCQGCFEAGFNIFTPRSDDIPMCDVIPAGAANIVQACSDVEMCNGDCSDDMLGFVVCVVEQDLWWQRVC